MRVAVLDDWQNAASAATDWSRLTERGVTPTFFREPLGAGDAASALAPFEFIIAMRERMAFPAALIDRLPRLRMIALTGRRSRVLDIAACTRRGVPVSTTGGTASAATTMELALGLLIAAMRHLPVADQATRSGAFQARVPVGRGLEGRTLGLIGLGRIGTRMARASLALGMRVLAWSLHLTAERAAAAHVEFVAKEVLLAQSDAVSLHLVLAESTRCILGAADLAQMKRGAVLVNTSRFPLVDEAALIAATKAGQITAALDVYPEEPLPPHHPLLNSPNIIFTPHIGYCTEEVFAQFYGECVDNILAFLDGKPARMLNPEALEHQGT